MKTLEFNIANRNLPLRFSETQALWSRRNKIQKTPLDSPGTWLICTYDLINYRDSSSDFIQYPDVNDIRYVYRVFWEGFLKCLKASTWPSTVDTDVVFICFQGKVSWYCSQVSRFPNWNFGSNLVMVIMSETRKSNVICESMGKAPSQSMPFFHAFTGSDTTSAFRGNKFVVQP